jgi:large subunit ribosomal protein L18
MAFAKDQFERRKWRTRANLRRRAGGRLRLSVFRSQKHIYGQVVDDGRGMTLVTASSLDRGLRNELRTGADVEAAKRVGALLAERAKAAGITEVVFDRGAYKYHGRVKALAEAAREGGLSF